MKLVPICGRKLCLTEKEKNLLMDAGNILLDMANDMNDDDIALLCSQIEESDFCSAKENKIFQIFSDVSTDSVKFLQMLDNFLFAIAQLTNEEE